MGLRYNAVTVCKDCTERHMGCHGTCERYKAQKAERDAERDAINRKKMNEYAMESHKRETQDYWRKRRNK